MMRRILAALALLGAAGPALAAVDVGTLTHQGDSITAPILFNAQFNSTLDVPGGLTFSVAQGQQGPVKLDLITGTNIVLAGAAIAGAADIGKLPLSLTSDTLFGGEHRFAISALTGDGKAGGVVYRLTLTPIPGAFVLLATAMTGLALFGVRRT